ILSESIPERSTITLLPSHQHRTHPSILWRLCSSILPISAHPVDVDYLSITSQFPNLLALSLINGSTLSRRRSYTVDADPSSIDADH
ncbi:hypothetical protein KI387_001110, partial [Taxus chinensis]